ncbi:MAG: AraC family transcriptional regulator [Paenibacillus sp.]|nr:AraC family transcriptional regulator [Paenibacillus sp.]
MHKFEHLEYEGEIDDIPRMPGGQERFIISTRSLSYYQLHYHDYVELSFYTAGEGFETINGIRHPIRPGTATFLLPHHMHTIQSIPGQQLHKHSCLFDIELLFGSQENDEFSRLLYGINSQLPSCVSFSGQPREHMLGIFEYLLSIRNQTNSPGYRHMIRTKLTEALLLFVRGGSHIADDQLIEKTEDTNRLFLLVLRYVHIHYIEPITLQDLSSRFHLSVPYISRSFKKNTGNTFVSYIHQLRINSAVNMLLHTNMSITDISTEVGFESFRTFARVFREVKGLTAREYRNLYTRLGDSAMDLTGSFLSTPDS